MSNVHFREPSIASFPAKISEFVNPVRTGFIVVRLLILKRKQTKSGQKNGLKDLNCETTRRRPHKYTTTHNGTSISIVVIKIICSNQLHLKVHRAHSTRYFFLFFLDYFWGCWRVNIYSLCYVIFSFFYLCIY